MLLGQLELISVVNKDKTAEPGDIISFTNHLLLTIEQPRKEAFRETETVGSLEAQPASHCLGNFEKMVAA